LRERKEDIHLLFRKFAGDFAEKYNMPPIRLSEDAVHVLGNYRWPGNVRQLKNITEQISIIEENRTIDGEVLKKYLPEYFESKLPAIYKGGIDEKTFSTERELLYKILFDMKKDIDEMKKTISNLSMGSYSPSKSDAEDFFNLDKKVEIAVPDKKSHFTVETAGVEDTTEYVEESLSIADKEKELIIKALEKYNGKRKYAAQDLGISERTLYRKLKEYEIEL